MGDVTRILADIEQGKPEVANRLLPLVYDELRRLAAQKMAHEAPDQTLQPTALVHEAWLRLVSVDEVQRWKGRGHFFGAAAEAMRRILIENARRKGREKRGAGLKPYRWVAIRNWPARATTQGGITVNAAAARKFII